MKSLLNLPLHYQILIALIVGSLLGIAFKPPVVTPQNIVGTVQIENGDFVLSETGDGGKTYFQTTIKATPDDPDKQMGELERRFDAVAEVIKAAPGQSEYTYTISDPSVQLISERNSITIRYVREQEGKQAISSIKAASRDTLIKEHPAWVSFYDEQSQDWRHILVLGAKALGDIFLSLLKMVTIPLIVTSLISGITGLGSSSQFGRMFGRTLLYYLCTSVLAITTGLIMVNLIQPGVGAILPGGGEIVAGENESLAGVFLGLVDKLIPTNIVEALANADFLSIIFFSILFGIFTIYAGGKTAEFITKMANSGFEVMMRMTMGIIHLAPLGVLAFMYYATATQGLDIFITLSWYMLAVFMALLFHAAVVLPLILKFVAKTSPLAFAKAMSPALMTAFSTASSNATLPLTITSVEQRGKVSNKVSSFVLPLGATINMDGTALYEAVAVLFIAQATPGIDLIIMDQILVAVTALLASVGAAGIPHAGLVMMAIVLQAVGLPLEAQGIIIAVDRVLDMCRTTVNVWSDSCGCAVIDRFESGTTGSTDEVLIAGEG
ncbi:Proton glutamate symport protein [Polystyrenella longa]|uniref:Proton glutamate symport protein n=1 Tax=Polystyrenella longa TaxID=2528007 RepID=A0A518CPD4_9PLAN|nr:dicarboxylate/amino acid:cation symporter [Polystyrenella longa]QDU81085.1 Proton glutamate symport protein [Polystyrenella longa]